MFKRRFATLQISREVQHALRNRLPIVSLESTIITHGLPFPQNFEMATKVEQELRSHGVIPATTAFINGIPKVGLTAEEIESLARSKASKVSRRDIPYVMANGLNGGTTISGTMILSHKAGIKIFATGGLGGVHRNGELTMDVSADLEELGRTPVAVVCAGPKSILDIERTMEYLETKGVFVGTLGTGMNIPGFYTRDSGVKSVYNFESFSEASNIIKSGDSLELNSGYLFCIPPPIDVALDSHFINKIVDDAIKEAIALGLKGKELTPFLLNKINVETKGKSVESNIQFVLNNARSAAQIALEYYKTTDHPVIEKIITPKEVNDDEVSYNKNNHNDTEVNSLVIGSVALDTYCSLQKVVMNDSNPSKISSSVGGVGHNVALESFKSGNASLRFVSIVGDDLYGDKIISSLKFGHSIAKTAGNTSQYISFHDQDGELIISSSDMDVIEQLSPAYVEQEIIKSKSKFVLMDANISIELMNHLVESSQSNGFSLIFEPTSSTKSTKLADAITNVPIFLATPTITELEAMYQSFETLNKFDLDYWFPIIDELGVDGTFRIKYENVCSKDPVKYDKLLKKGILQLGVSLLPFINTLLIKDGANGVYLLSLHKDISQISEEPRASFSLKSKGKNGQGVLFEHYAVPSKIDRVNNVTGAGDAFIGHILSELKDKRDSLSGASRFGLIHAAQKKSIAKISVA